MIRACASQKRLLRTGWAILLPLMLISCGARRGTVEGKITVDGHPVTAGRVFFQGADQQVAFAYISPQGTYRAVDVPAGTAKVYVTAPTRMEREKMRRQSQGKGKKLVMPEAGEEPPGSNDVAIPQKYQIPESSGLTCTVTSGTTTFDIEMTSK